MIWALLALLGIPIWFIAVVLLAAFRNRNHARANPDIFEFKRRKGDGWQRGKSYARWVSDAMIVHSGIALMKACWVSVMLVDLTLCGLRRDKRAQPSRRPGHVSRPSHASSHPSTVDRLPPR